MMARPSSSRRRDARRCASSNESIWAIVSADAGASAPRWLGPRDPAIRLEDFAADVQLVAAKDVLPGARRDLAQHLTVPADELNPVFALAPLLDRDRDALRSRLIVGQLDAGRRIEVAALECLDDRSRRHSLGPNEHPPAPRPGDIGIDWLLEHMRVIVGHAEHRFGAGNGA